MLPIGGAPFLQPEGLGRAPLTDESLIRVRQWKINLAGSGSARTLVELRNSSDQSLVFEKPQMRVDGRDRLVAGLCERLLTGIALPGSLIAKIRQLDENELGCGFEVPLGHGPHESFKGHCVLLPVQSIRHSNLALREQF